MPGTILVSVLELADLPSSPSNEGDEGGQFSLKVALGKREYQTKGKGDFSFPVSSLRDNLVMTLHDAEGNGISRAVIKTMQVMEKGFWDAWFPFEGGGNAHMTFQFSLSENERKRIYERRESAVKTKYTDLISSGRRHSFSDEILRPSTPKPYISEEILRPPTPKTAIELQKESYPTDQLQQTAPEASSTQLVSLFPQELQKHPDSDSDQVKVLRQLLPDNARELQESVGEILNPNSAEKGRQVCGNLISAQDSASLLSLEDGGDAYKKQNDVEKHSASLVKKMIGAFESSTSQENTPRSHMEPTKTSRLRKFESTGSLKEAWFDKGQLGTEKSYSGNISVAETLTKSFSSMMPFEMNPEQSPEFVKSLPQRELEDKSSSGNFVNQESSGMLRLNAVEYDNLSHAAEDALSSGVPEAAQTSQMVSSGELEENLISISSTSHHDSSVDVIHVDIVEGCCTDEPFELGEDERSHNPSTYRMQPSLDIAHPDNDCSNREDEQVDATESPANETLDGNDKFSFSSTYTEQVAVDIVITESALSSCRNEFVALAHDQISREEESCSLSTYQEQYLTAEDEAGMESLDRNNDGFTEPSSRAGSSEMLDMATETCFLWYPSFWKRRPCITTGTGQLIDFLEGCDMFLGTYPQKSLTELNAMKERKKHGGLLDKAFKDKDIFSIRKKSNSECILPMPKMSGGWIEQGLRVIILVVACGTLILGPGAR